MKPVTSSLNRLRKPRRKEPGKNYVPFEDTKKVMGQLSTDARFKHLTGTNLLLVAEQRVIAKKALNQLKVKNSEKRQRAIELLDQMSMRLLDKKSLGIESGWADDGLKSIREQLIQTLGYIKYIRISRRIRKIANYNTEIILERQRKSSTNQKHK